MNGIDTCNIIDYPNSQARLDSTGKVSVPKNYRAWRDFFEVKKEIDEQDDLFASNGQDTGAKYQHIENKFYEPRLLKKSESLDSSHSPSLMDVLLVKSSFDDKKFKIKSNKDLANVRNAKSISKSSNLKTANKKSKKSKLNEKL